MKKKTDGRISAPGRGTCELLQSWIVADNGRADRATVIALTSLHLPRDDPVPSFPVTDSNILV